MINAYQIVEERESMEKIRDRIAELAEEIASLPSGYISKKTINGKIKQYYQWNEDGKKKSKYLDDETASEMALKIDYRRKLQKELRDLQKQLPKKNTGVTETEIAFRTSVLIGSSLKAFVKSAKELKKRNCYEKLQGYLERNETGKVMILYGLRRTGKTTLIRQAIASMSTKAFSKTVFIQIQPGMNLGDVNFDLKWLIEHEYRYVFIDEVTLAEDFIEGAALFSDIYAMSGMKIVLSGTDSLGFLFSESDELYDRCYLLHTTFIPYREFEQVLGVSGIDEYIRFGGTMSLGGEHYNEAITFSTKESTDEYIDSAIARNIQHSLRYYQDGGHFRHLAELYDKNELTSAINRVVEDINHRFTIEVLTRDFLSGDLGVSKRNLRRDRNHPTDILDRIDVETFTNGLRRALEILNKNERRVQITDSHRTEIKEYLDLLDLTVDIPTEYIPAKNEKLYKTAIAQPGMRYAQAEALVRQLLLDQEMQNLSALDRAWVLERILNEIKGRMMEDIVLLETTKSCPKKDVFRLQFPIGEFDMVIVDPVTITCEIYEIKHSKEAIPGQYKNLIQQDKIDATEFRFGKITRKAVIYRGESKMDGEIEYINVEEYLREL